MKRFKLIPISPEELQEFLDQTDYTCWYCDELATCRCTESVDKEGFWRECAEPVCRSHALWYKGKPYCVRHFPLRELYLKLSQLDKRRENQP